MKEVADLREKLMAEYSVYANMIDDKNVTLTAGIADAVALDNDGRIETVIDWKSDVSPGSTEVQMYRAQVRDYLAATGARVGLIIFLSTGHVERVTM